MSMKKKKAEDELIIEDITDTAPDLVVDEGTAPKEKKGKRRSKNKHKKEEAKQEEAKPEETEREEAKPEETEPEEAEPVSEDVAVNTKADPEEIAVSSKEDSNQGNAGKKEEEPVGEIVIDMKNIVKRYFIGQPNELEVLHGIDMQVRRGEFVAIVGQSGSGKSTLMNMIGALDRPTEGEYTLDGVDMFKAKDKDLSAIRCKKIGFVFQTYNLVARTSAQRNVELPMLYGGVPMRLRSRKAKELLEMVEMADRMKHQPDELSGGQKQRVAIARAMANDPAIILADEPTGALDSVTGRLIMDIFHKLHEEQGKTIILITHSPELASECSRILTLKDGLIIDERKGSGRRADN